MQDRQTGVPSLKPSRSLEGAGLLAAALLAAVLVGAVTWVALERIESRSQKEVGDTLTTVLETTEQAIHNWHQERAADISLWAQSPALVGAVETLLDTTRNAAALRQSPAQKELRDLLGSALAVQGYQGFFVISPEGVNLASSRDADIGVISLLVGGFFEKMLRNGPLVSLPLAGDVRLSDIDGETFAIEPTMFVGGPIKDARGSIVAVLTFRLDTVNDFTKILTRSRIGETGETYAFDGRGLLISNSRYVEDLRAAGLIGPREPDILNLRLRDPGGDLLKGHQSDLRREEQPLTVMAREAVSGKAGRNVAGYRNYRGLPVIGAWVWEKSLGMGIATEISREEAYGFMRTIRRLLLGTTTFAVVLLFGITLLFLASRRRIAEEETNVQAILDSAADGIISIDDNGTIERLNPAAITMFGYKPDEIIGKNVKILMPEPFRGEHDGYLKNYHRTGNRKIIGLGREVEGLRKDGSVFPLDLTVSETVIRQRKHYVGTIRDITERKRVDRMKAEFISTVSHELRTPLTSIRGSLGLITGGAVGEIPKRAIVMVSLAQKNTERLIGLVNDILDMEKMESGAMEFNFETVDVPALVEQAMAANHGFAEEHGVEFVLLEPKPDAYVHGDADRLMQVVVNLLSNATKFSPRGNKVEIQVSCRSGTVRVMVGDNGPGIPEEFRSQIFRRFSQADSSDTRKTGGTGLGLNISKAIIDRHGGHIDFISPKEGGTTFFFDLPEKHVVSDDQGISKKPELGRGRRILICEDDPDVARIIAATLENDGFDTVIAGDAEQARLILGKTEVDAMTVDIKLPGQDGLAFIDELRRRESTKELPCVVVSAFADDACRKIEGSVMGVMDWLEKPVDRERLLSVIRRISRRSNNSRPRILYVEDDADLVQFVLNLLRDMAEVVTVGTLAAADRAVTSDEFDLVILDVQLPDGSGIDLLKRLKNGGSNSTPVVIFSAKEVNKVVADRVEAALVKSRTTNDILIDTIKGLINGENRQVNRS